MTDIHVVFTRYEKSFISRAIMWFTRKREHPERDCSHVLWKVKPGGCFEASWAAFEAMERGVWLSFFNKALGKQTIVADFRVKTTVPMAQELTRWMLHEYLGENYDYVGIALWAEWILASRWFGTIVKWLNLKFRPGKVRQKFCSGLVVVGLKRLQELDPVGWGVDDVTARTSSPRQLIDVLVDMPSRYEYTGGVIGERAS